MLRCSRVHQFGFLRVLGPIFLVLFTLAFSTLGHAQTQEWASPKTQLPTLTFNSPTELKETLMDHGTVAKYYRPEGPMVVTNSYRYEVNSDRSVSSLKYDVGIKLLGITRPFQGDVTFNSCTADLSKCSLKIDMRKSSPGIADMIPEMKLSFLVTGKNADGTIQVQPRLMYLKGPKYDEILGKLPSGMIENATRNQIKPLLSALESYRAAEGSLGLLENINGPESPLMSPGISKNCALSSRA